MTLSETEKKMLEKLRRREALLRKWRWALVILHGALVIGNFYLLVTIANFPDDPPGVKALIASHFIAPIFLFMGFSAAWVGYLIANWNGNAKTVLLLKLVDEHREETKAA